MAVTCALLMGCRLHHEKHSTSPGAKFGALPPAVQNAIRAETGGAELADIERATNHGEPIYVVYLANAEAYPPLFIALDGSVLKPDLTVAVGGSEELGGIATSTAASRIDPKDLPATVLGAMKQRVPDGVLTSVDKETWGNQPVYVLTFKDEKRQPKLYIGADGTVLNGTQH